MNKQLRIIVADTGDETATRIAACFAGEGAWAVTRLQRQDKLVQAVRKEHADVLILNLSTSTIHVPLLTDALLRCSEIVIFALYRKESAGLSQILTQQGVHYLPYPEHISDLTASVYRISGFRAVNPAAEEPVSDPELMITHLLHRFGIPTNLCGFHFLRAAILTAYRRDIRSGNITNLIYPEVAQSQHSTPTRVERAIRHAIIQAWENADRRIEIEFGIRDGHRMTNSEFISFAVDWLRTRQCVRRYG